MKAQPLRFLLHRAHWLAALLFCFTTSTSLSQEELAFSVYTGPRSLDGIQTTPLGREPEDLSALFVAELFREAGLEFSLTVIPWSRAIQAAQSEANVMVYSMIRNAQREDLFEWIGLINPIETHLYALRGKLAELPTTLEEARQYSIGLARRSAADDWLRDQGFTNLIYSGDATRSPLLMDRGRIDLTPMTRQEAIGLTQDYELEEDALIPVVRLDELSTGTYFVVSKQTNAVLVQHLKDAYQTLVDNGAHERFFGPINQVD